MTEASTATPPQDGANVLIGWLYLADQNCMAIYDLPTMSYYAISGDPGVLVPGDLARITYSRSLRTTCLDEVGPQFTPVIDQIQPWNGICALPSGLDPSWVVGASVTEPTQGQVVLAAATPGDWSQLWKVELFTSTPSTKYVLRSQLNNWIIQVDWNTNTSVYIASGPNPNVNAVWTWPQTYPPDLPDGYMYLSTLRQTGLLSPLPDRIRNLGPCL